MRKGLTGQEVAIVGMACRFPKSDDIDAFWLNILNGRDCVSRFSNEMLADEGIDANLLNNKQYVKAKPYINNADCFDADFFGYTQSEATRLDPKTRIFHQVVYHALENAGYLPSPSLNIGLFAGASEDLEWLRSTLLQDEQDGLDKFETGILNHKDLLSHFIAYKLNLTGPVHTVYSSCSTSLAATHLACQSLLLGECDLAVAGGVTLDLPQKAGYLYKKGLIHSTDGVCRPFSSDSSGTLFGDGAGAVVLKRYEDAIKDNDSIYAVIRATAINNDGHRKAGFTAPSRAGQCSVIKAAHDLAEVSSDSFGYVETHGTATRVGDPIEFDALKEAFATEKKNYCALGSVKANIGHTHAAAGIAGLIKASLSVYYGKILPLTHFRNPNEEIDLGRSPFYFPQEVLDWPEHFFCRRAGVSSFGIGGTNVHAVIENHDLGDDVASDEVTSFEETLFTLSTKQADLTDRLELSIRNWVDTAPLSWLKKGEYTSMLGRNAFQFRRALLVLDMNGRRSISAVPCLRSSKSEDFCLYMGDLVTIKMATSMSHVENCVSNEVFAFFGTSLTSVLAGQNPKSNIYQGLLWYALGKWAISLIPNIKRMAGNGLSLLAAATCIGFFEFSDYVDLLADLDKGNLLPEIPKLSVKQGYYLLDQTGNRISQDQLEDDGYWAQLIVSNSNSRETSEAWLDIGKWLCKSDCKRDLVSYWLSGGHVNWMQLFASQQPGRISFPAYPFSDQKFPFPKTSHHKKPKSGIEPNFVPAVSLDTSSFKPRPSMSTSFIEPDCAIKIFIAGCFSELLEIQPIGIKDHFFELGGHSILATQLLAHIESTFQLELDFQVLMENPSVEGIYQLLKNKKGSGELLSECFTRFLNKPENLH